MIRKTGFWLSLFAGSLFSALMIQTSFAQPVASSGLEPVTVYKSPTCGCCKKWVQHLKNNGFEVSAIDRNDMVSIKAQSGIPRELASCHTAMVGGYVIEGHVPANDIKRLLTERPKISGLSVPGMPMGSPGMEGSRKDNYQVITFSESGENTVFSRY